MDQRTRSVRTRTLVAMGGFVALAALVVVMFRTGGPGLSGPGRILGGTAAITVLVVWWVVFATRIFKAQDEYMREAERFAWHWGGLMGLMASVPVWAFIGLGGLHWLNPASDVGPVASRAFTTGYMLPLMMQVIGAVSVGLWWRWGRR
jgi:hypothetical protein